MLFYTFVLVLLVWVVQKQWKMRKILALSRKLRNRYVAFPIIGHGLLFFGTSEERMETIKKIAYEAIINPFKLTSIWLGSQYYAFTCDPDIIAIVTKTSFDKAGLAGLSRHLMGNGLIFAPVDIWRPRRKVLAPTFSQKNLNAFMNIFAEQSVVMTNCLKPKAGNEAFSIWDNISSYTMDSVCQTAFGVQVNAQKQTFNNFVSVFTKYCTSMSIIVFQPWLHGRLLSKLALLYYDAEKQKNIIHGFVDGIIRRKLDYEPIGANLNTESNNDGKIMSFLDILITSAGGSNGYTDVELREEILVLLLAGTDTSAVGACFTIVLLSRNLDVQEKVYKEIYEIFGDSKRPITSEDLTRLKYMDAVLKESLRLYPPVPLIVRQNYEDIKLPSGMTLPVGSSVTINIWGLHRNPQYWGTDADDFNPDRFLDGAPMHRAAYIPFSYGPRNCLGYQYAMMSMKTALVTLLQEYRVLPPTNISPEDLKKPLRTSYAIMMKDLDNFKVRLERRA